MIKMLRIDDRLIHGQVAVVWSKELGVDRIVVANDSAAANPVQTATLKMAAPSTVKCSVMSVADAVEVMCDPRAAGMKVLLIVNNPHDANTICKACGPDIVKLFDVGNYGLIAGQDSRRKVGDTFYVNDEETTELKEIAALGIPSVYQLVPTIAAQNITDIL